MLCVMPTIVAAVLLGLAGFSFSGSVNPCLNSNLVTVKSGLSCTRSVYIDGAQIAFGSSKDFSITRGSGIVAVQIKQGSGNLLATAIKLYPAVKKFVCTRSTAVSDSTWTHLQYNDLTWPISITLPSTNNWISAFAPFAKFNYDLKCRAYLACHTGSATVPTTRAATRRSRSSDSSDSSEETDSSDSSEETASTAVPTTSTTTTTTTTTTITAAPSTAAPIPIVEGVSGGGNFQGGQPATLQCIFSASQLPDVVTWYLNDVELVDSNSNSALASDGSLVASYSIPAVGVFTAGQYTCKGSNANGYTLGPVINIAVNYSSVVIDIGADFQVSALNGAISQSVLLQASQGCQGLNIRFQETSSPFDSGSNNYVSFDADAQTIIVNDVVPQDAVWPSECNNANVWVWVTLTDSLLSVGTGPTIGLNTAASYAAITGTPNGYLAFGNSGSTLQSYFLYQPLP